jgi:hypothetical protein
MGVIEQRNIDDSAFQLMFLDGTVSTSFLVEDCTVVLIEYPDGDIASYIDDEDDDDCQDEGDEEYMPGPMD